MSCRPPPVTVDVKKANRPVDAALQKEFQYYSPEIHAASFVLPEFARKKLYE